jgi:hypothetical protein
VLPARSSGDDHLFDVFAKKRSDVQSDMIGAFRQIARELLKRSGHQFNFRAARFRE